MGRQITVYTQRGELTTKPDNTKVPMGFIMQPGQWHADRPSEVWAALPECGSGAQFCVVSNGELIGDLARRWTTMMWVSQVVVPYVPGDKICSGVIIRGEWAEGLVSTMFFQPPPAEHACVLTKAACQFEHTQVTLAHGNFSERQANGHSASTMLNITCDFVVQGKMTLRSGADSQRVALNNGGKSRLYLSGMRLGSTLRLTRGLNSLELTDSLEFNGTTKLGPFKGSAVLVLDLD